MGGGSGHPFARGVLQGDGQVVLAGVRPPAHLVAGQDTLGLQLVQAPLHPPLAHTASRSSPGPMAAAASPARHPSTSGTATSRASTPPPLFPSGSRRRRRTRGCTPTPRPP